MDNQHMRKPVYLRGLSQGGLGAPTNAVPTAPALIRQTALAKRELVGTINTLNNAGAVAIVATQIQQESTPAPMLTSADPGPGQATTQSATRAGTGSDGGADVARAVGVESPPVTTFVRKLPPIVGGPLKWGVPIGIGLYALGHHKIGTVVAALGAARWALFKGYLGNV